jgi:predicted homoserine dehydrogenase-like protein
MGSIIPGLYFVRKKKKKKKKVREVTQYLLTDTTYIVLYHPFDLTKSKVSGLEARN